MPRRGSIRSSLQPPTVLNVFEAAHSTLSASDFLLHRLESMDDGIRCCTYRQSEVGAAIKHGLEVR